MSVLPMKRVFIAALKKDRKPILESLQRLGTVEVTPIDLNSGEEAETGAGPFSRLDTSSSVATFDKNAALAEQALQVLDAEVPPKGGLLDSFAGRKQISLSDYESGVKKRDNVMDAVYDLVSLQKKRAEALAEVPKIENQLETLAPWLSFGLPLDFKGTKQTVAFVGTVPGAHTIEGLTTALAEKAPEADAVDVEIISTGDELTCVFVLAHKSCAKACEEGLRQLGFARPSISASVPKEQEERLKAALVEAEGSVGVISEQIAAYAPRREEIRFIADYFKLRGKKYSVIADLSQTKHAFVLTGFVAAKDAPQLEKEIGEKFDCVVELADPDPNEDVPVVLRNNAYARPIEGVVAGYSLPGKGEIDPTFLASLFYYCLFGMMLSDAGYGIIMMIACAFVLIKFKDTIEPGMKRSMQMFFGCGVGTTFWGFMFGSFFGDAVNKFATTFLNRPDITLGPIWFEPVKEPITMLGFAFIVGLIHLFTGLGALAYTDIKAGKIADAIYDVLFWYMLVGGAIGLLLTTDMISSMFELNLNLPPAFATVMLVLVAIGAVGILFTGGRESKNWGKRILKGLYAIYGISSYLSDMLSYSRLLALGLATGVISSVFNQMGTMAGNGPVGLVMFIVVFIIGHILNLLINALGAYVHTNRLEYVEFFGKFYNGGGRALEPFAQNTDYVKVVE